ncbi:MAG: flippase activity-associated protein Agl23 [Chloroflexota bacterium]
MEQKQNWLDRPIHPALPAITNEIAIFAGIILLAIVTRFYDLESRVMSHDESLHTYFSWLLYRGQGYEHTPMMHGPLQFHMLALVYFLFGASDFTSRIPAVLFNIATIWMVWYWRRYLGKWGALIAGFLLIISPYILYYARYVRNESFTGLSGVIMLYVILRYLEAGDKKYLYMLAAAYFLHFATKETAFIYAAQALLYFAIYFIARVTRRSWDEHQREYRGFVIALAVAVLLGGIAAGVAVYGREQGTLSATETAAPSDPLATGTPLDAPGVASISPAVIVAAAALLAIGVAAYFLITGYTWERVRAERSFDLLMLTGMIVLPMLSPLPLKWTENWLHVTIPAEAPQVQALLTDTRALLIIGAFLALMYILSFVAGYIWNKDLWWKIALLFWVPYVIFFTTIFTNGNGFFTGVIGSVGYWLVQQGVERGSQPWYYYILIQIPIYEFLPALGLILAIVVGLRRRLAPRAIAEEDETTTTEQGPVETGTVMVPRTETTEELNFPNMFSLLVWWSITIVIALSFAGERMPWLTFHMAWPMILLTGWALGHLVETTDWQGLRERGVLFTLGAVTTFLLSLFGLILVVNGENPPFQGRELAQLQATSSFLLQAAVALISLFAASYLMRNWAGRNIRNIFTLVFFAMLGVLTARAAFRAAYITYDQAREFLVYAHATTDVKEVIAQAKEISERTTGGMGVALAYDASAPDTGVSWPMVWYLRDFTNQRSFDQPTRSLRDSVVVIVDQKNFDKIEAALGPGYYRFDYIRMWWPMQDYFSVVNERNPLFSMDAQQASALDAGQLTDELLVLFQDMGRPLTPAATLEVKAKGNRWLISDEGIQYEVRKGQQSLAVYDFSFPPDYPCTGVFSVFRLFKTKDYTKVCDAFTNREVRRGIINIWLDRDYTVYSQAIGRSDLTLTTWQPSNGMRLYIRKDVAAQIWNYGIGPEDVTDVVDPTEGKYVTLGADLIFDANQVNPVSFNLPRSLAFADDGTVYVADSMNHRILHLDPEGKTLHEWGSFADGVSIPADPGTFNEPWGIAVGPDGSVYVSDTWNHRVQKFTSTGQFIKQWGFFGQGEVPDAFYGPRGLAVNSRGDVFVADTGNKRIVVFDADGNFVTEFGGAGFDPGLFDEPVGVAVDHEGIVYVADTWNQRIQTFFPSEDGQEYVPAKQWDVYGWFGQSTENKPFIAVNDAGHVFITDPEGYRVIEFDDAGQVVRVWGEYGNSFTNFALPSGIAIDPDGLVWVSDSPNNRVMRFTLP